MIAASATTQTTREEREGVFERVDALDTEQILNELKGLVTDEYFYVIPGEGGKEQLGLSWAGTKWIANQMAVGETPHPLSVEHIEVVETPESFRAIATVKDTATGAKRQGTYEQLKFRRRNVTENKRKVGEEEVFVKIYKDGKVIREERQRDPHAFTIASSKAQRNGMRHFMEEPLILKLAEQWKKQRAEKKSAGGAKDITGESKVTDVTPPSVANGHKSLEEVQFAFKDFAVDIGEYELKDYKGFKVTYPPTAKSNEVNDMLEIGRKLGGKYITKDEGGPAILVPK